MQYHRNAKTNIYQREAMKMSKESCRILARRYHVSADTISRWRRADHLEDGSSCPKRPAYSLDPYEQALVCYVRKVGGLNLDEIVSELSSLLPHFNRSNIYRTLKRNKLNRKEEKEKPKRGVFSSYRPGFLHIDCFYLPRLKGSERRYCFVAVDRATRILFVWVYPSKDAASAVNFLKRCLAFFPFKIHRILTDNGRQFTNVGMRSWNWDKVKKDHPFDELCRKRGILHKRIKPAHPWTNGLVENAIGLIKEKVVKNERHNSWEQLEQALHSFQLNWNLFHKHKSLALKRPYQVVLEWYERKPTLFVKDPTVMLSGTW